MSIQTTDQQITSVAQSVAVDPQQVLAYLGLSPSDPRSQAVVAVAQRYQLDPLLKHVIVIPKGGVYITRDGLLHVAHRSGQLDGIVVEQEPVLDADGKEWVARVSVYRRDMAHPFTFPGRYPVAGSNRDYAQEMALKAAEAHALRRAFDVTGMPVLEEERPPRRTSDAAPDPAATGRLRQALQQHERYEQPDEQEPPQTATAATPKGSAQAAAATQPRAEDDPARDVAEPVSGGGPVDEGEPEAAPSQPPSGSPPHDQPTTSPRPGTRPTRAQMNMLFARLDALGVDTSDKDGGEGRRAVCSVILARRVDSFEDLSRNDVSFILDTLAPLTTPRDLDDYLATLEQPDSGGER